MCDTMNESTKKCCTCILLNPFVGRINVYLIHIICVLDKSAELRESVVYIEPLYSNVLSVRLGNEAVTAVLYSRVRVVDFCLKQMTDGGHILCEAVVCLAICHACQSPE